MLLSRMIGKGRVARAERPSFVGAWGLVLADFVLVLLVFVPIALVIITWTEGGRISNVTAIVSLVFVFFVPMQILLITSGIWAAKSRWIEEEKG